MKGLNYYETASGDYDDFLQYDEEMIKEIRPLAEEFIEAVDAII
jgi:hypothetical protein